MQTYIGCFAGFIAPCRKHGLALVSVHKRHNVFTELHLADVYRPGKLLARRFCRNICRLKRIVVSHNAEHILRVFRIRSPVGKGVNHALVNAEQIGKQICLCNVLCLLILAHADISRARRRARFRNYHALPSARFGDKLRMIRIAASVKRARYRQRLIVGMQRHRVHIWIRAVVKQSLQKLCVIGQRRACAVNRNIGIAFLYNIVNIFLKLRKVGKIVSSVLCPKVHVRLVPCFNFTDVFQSFNIQRNIFCQAESLLLRHNSVTDVLCSVKSVVVTEARNVIHARLLRVLVKSVQSCPVVAAFGVALRFEPRNSTAHGFYPRFCHKCGSFAQPVCRWVVIKLRAHAPRSENVHKSVGIVAENGKILFIFCRRAAAVSQRYLYSIASLRKSRTAEAARGFCPSADIHAYIVIFYFGFSEKVRHRVMQLI